MKIATESLEATVECFMASIEPCGDCWQWTGKLFTVGYGRFNLNGRQFYAHRVAYELFVGPIPKGFDIHHLCGNRVCVNPQHLEAKAHACHTQEHQIENSPMRNKTHCVRGHPFDEANTYHYGGRRLCRACNKMFCTAKAKERRERRRIAAQANREATNQARRDRYRNDPEYRLKMIARSRATKARSLAKHRDGRKDTWTPEPVGPSREGARS